MITRQMRIACVFFYKHGKSYIDYDKTFIKVYGDKRIRAVRVATCRASGYDGSNQRKKCTVNDKKLHNNISRAKSTVKEIIICNEWDWFFTGTLNPRKYNREDLEKYHKDLTQWFRNYGKKHDIKIKFLLIPELHSDGKSWHIHGLLKGLPVKHLKQFKIGNKMGQHLAKRVKDGEIIYNWVDYKKKFGFCDLEPIHSQERLSNYITKYISKDLYKCVKELNAHTYYCSKGLSRAKTIKKGYMSWDNIQPTHKNDYCTILDIPYSRAKADELTALIN